jgi:F0F1-type ATP synthase delta subunit
MDKTAIYGKAFLESIRGLSEKEILPVLMRFKEILKKREESHLYPRILRNVISSLEYQENAVVTSARELDKTTLAGVLQKLEKNFPEIAKENLHFKIDEKMLGGVKIAYRDFLFDGTIKEVLRKMMKT